MTERKPNKDELRKTGLQKEISTDAETEKEASKVLELAEIEQSQKKIAGYHFFRRYENWISLVVFSLSGFSVVVIMICFIAFLFGRDVSFIDSLINSSGNGAGYLLLAVIAPALFIAAGNFKHRRGDTKSATLADKITKDVSDEL